MKEHQCFPLQIPFSKATLLLAEELQFISFFLSPIKFIGMTQALYESLL